MQLLSTAQLAFILPASIVAIDIIRRFIQGKLQRKWFPLPPGPTPIPLLGNVLSVDRERPWETYTEWHAIYGDIFYHRILDQDIVVLGSRSVAVELLEKRSRIYSDRPFIATLGPRIFHQTYRADTALNHHPVQLRKARQLVIDMIRSPNHYEDHYAVFGIAVPLSASYGYETDTQDPVVCAFKNFAAAAVPAATPEKAILLKLFPFLLHIPDWLPGSTIKREANRTRDLSTKITEIPYQYAEERMGTSNEQIVSMVSDHLARIPDHTDRTRGTGYTFNLKKAGVSSTLAGSDTTLSALMVFTLAMVLNPHVLKRAQAEIDTVVGTDHLPDFGDRPTLPYVNAIIRETLRWQPITPLGIWHATTNSDIYKDQYIPKGATVVANIWAMSRDEARFPNAEDFVPERFLDDDGRLNDNDPTDFVFGFGRRICPGLHTADASLFIAIVTMLAVLDISPLQDAQGTLEVKWVNGITHRPKSFPCRISPRAHVNWSHVEHMRAELNRV